MAPLAPMAPGTVGTIYVTGYLDSDNYLPGQSICLTGQFWSEYPEDFANLSTDNTSGACHYVTGEIADLTIAKTLLTDLSTVQEGDPVAYRVDYRNIGNDVALGVSLTDVMPTYLDGLEYLTSDCTSINQTISCDLGDVAAGDQ